MISEEEIDNAKDILKNCIADYVIGSFCVNKDCMDRDMCKDKDCPYIISIDTVIKYIVQLEKENKELKKKLTPEAMLKDLKRSKLYEKGGNI